MRSRFWHTLPDCVIVFVSKCIISFVWSHTISRYFKILHYFANFATIFLHVGLHLSTVAFPASNVFLPVHSVPLRRQLFVNIPLFLYPCLFVCLLTLSNHSTFLLSQSSTSYPFLQPSILQLFNSFQNMSPVLCT